jgi:HlyD family secretion protein
MIRTVVRCSIAMMLASLVLSCAAERIASFRVATVTRGDLVQAVSATGTLEPEELRDVTTQVAGQIVSFGDDPRGSSDPRYKGKPIDCGSPVDEGTILARIDNKIYAARVEQEKASHERAKAELALAQLKKEPGEAGKLALVAAEAAVAQSNAALKQAQLNLDATIIRSPVKGVIIRRRVNLGQNVGPTNSNSSSLFLIAKDFKKMQVWASVNKADIGRIREGLEARFTVDPFPDQVFAAKVTQIRNNAQSVQNVVVYTVVLEFDNPDLRLMPYMTANIKFTIETRHNVLRVPDEALRWNPRPVQVAADVGGKADIERARQNAASMGRLWVKDQDGRHVRPIDVQVGLTDGILTEISGSELKEGMEVVVGEEKDGTEVKNPMLPRFPGKRPAGQPVNDS